MQRYDDSLYRLLHAMRFNAVEALQRRRLASMNVMAFLATKVEIVTELL